MRCATRAGRRSTTPVSTPARRTASPRSNWCAAPRSRKTPARTGRMSRSASPPCGPRAAASAPDLNSLIVQYPQPPRPLASVSGACDAAMRHRAAAVPRRRRQRPMRSLETRGRATGRGRSRRLPGDVQDPRPRQPRRQRRRQEPARLHRDDRARSRGARRAGEGSDRVPRSQLQAERGRAAAAGPGLDLSRRRVRRPRPDGRRRQGRNRAARLRRRRQGQDRAYRASSATRDRPA